MSNLPEGFKMIKPDLMSHVTFDMVHKRFYVSRHISRQYNFENGTRVGLAYDTQNRKLLLDTRGTAFLLDKRGYITSMRFSQELTKLSAQYDGMTVRYALNADESDDRFIVLDEEWIE